MLSRFKYSKCIGSFLSDQAGSIAVSFGLSTMGLAVVGFGAINLANVDYIKTQAQNTVDEAALALAAGNDTNKYQKTADDFMAKNFLVTQVTNQKVKASYDAKTHQWNVVLSGKFDNQMASIFGVSTLNVSATSTGDLPQILNKITFTPGNIQGWFDKTVTLLGVDSNTKATTSLWNLTYKYNMGKPTVVSSKANVTVTGYDQLYLRMDIDPKSYGFATYGSYTTNSTNSANLINYIKIDGKVLTVPLDLVQAVGCSVTKNYQWEDGGNSDYLDFVFTASGSCSSGPDLTSVRLSN